MGCRLGRGYRKLPRPILRHFPARPPPLSIALHCHIFSSPPPHFHPALPWPGLCTAPLTKVMGSECRSPRPTPRPMPSTTLCHPGLHPGLCPHLYPALPIPGLHPGLCPCLYPALPIPGLHPGLCPCLYPALPTLAYTPAYALKVALPPSPAQRDQNAEVATRFCTLRPM